MGFLGDRDFPFGHPPPPRCAAAPPRSPTAPPTQPRRAVTPPAPPQADASEARDDSEDFVGTIFYEWETPQTEGQYFQIPADMTDDKQ